MDPASYLPAIERSNPVQGTTEDHRTRSASSISAVLPHPWDGYLSGPENELAIAAAQAMARGEHDGISPLVIYGPSGVGKSRLLAGLVTERLRRQPNSVVASLNAQAFVSACLEAAGIVGRAGWSTLRGRFRSVDLFILEDLEGLERGPLARDELVHILNALEATGAAVAFSARTAPATWPNQAWPRRLIARLMGGLATCIAPPGLTSRRRYVFQHADLQGVALHAEAVEVLAQTADGYRTLEGWISRLALETRLKNEQGRAQERERSSHIRQQSRRYKSALLDLHTVTTILADEHLLAKPLVTIDVIARDVATRFGVQLRMMRGQSRRASTVRTRHIAMYLARTFTGMSFSAIGAYFSDRDPATVRYACKVIAGRLNVDPILAAALARLEALWSRTGS
jgi:chromosomal replication initiator protein